ncbi:MAG: ribosome small subunit-dependent GTPase A [Oscillospiraceae bacterium]|nr:ribosome small subunit-dependent GTPase A [Oscillospiraceae bacterium]
MTGQIVKALSGFYYVDTGAGAPVPCRGRGKLRHQKATPLVGDGVEITCLEDGTGMVDAILPRKNQFSRPAVANIDQLVIVCSGAIPVTDPFLIDRMAAMAEWKGCEPLIVFNKCDLVRVDALAELYRAAGFSTLQVSAETGEGMDALAAAIAGKVSAFTGNSGVGKSSILNALQPGFSLRVGEVSEKLGRGRHTTRHVELFPVAGGLVADTPGFSSFDVEQMEAIPKEELAVTFREFAPYLDQCRFQGCAHVKERGCAVREALAEGRIASSRHESYVRLYEQAKEIPDWERIKSK